MGQARPRAPRACGRRGTTPTLPPSRASRVAVLSPPTPACPSAAWPTACWSLWPRPASDLLPFWSAMWATVTFTFGYLIGQPAPQAPSGRATQSPIGAAGAGAGRHSVTGEHGVGLHKMDFAGRGGRWGSEYDAHHQARALDPQKHHESRQDFLRSDGLTTSTPGAALAIAFAAPRLAFGLDAGVMRGGLVSTPIE